MASSVTTDNQQVRTSTSGLKFGPEWMRNPPQQESFPQRQFALAQYRYGREEMLQIFEQIAAKQSEMAPPDELTQVPPDFPDMVDTFQLPVAYQSPLNERRNDQDNLRRGDTFPANTTDALLVGSIAGRGGRGGRAFTNGGTGRWTESISRNRQRSDQDDDWRNHGDQNKGGTGTAPDAIFGDNGSVPKQRIGSESWESKDSGWNRAGQRRSVPNTATTPGSGTNENRSGSFWPQNTRNDRWNNNVPPKKMPEWLDTDTADIGGVFDGSGNFTDSSRDGPFNASQDGKEDSTSDMGSKRSEMSQSELSQSESPAPDTSKDSPQPPVPAQPNEIDQTDHAPETRDPVLKVHPQETTPDDVFPVPVTMQSQQQQQPPLHQPPPQQQQQQLGQHPNAVHRMDPMMGPMGMSQPPPPVVQQQQQQQPWFDSMTMDWFYKDPNGQIQGPFSSRDMGEWSDLGYFKDDLLIRRSVDQQFLPLGQVQQRYQCNPFRSMRHPPALMNPPPPPQPQPVPMNRQPPGMVAQTFVSNQAPPPPVQAQPAPPQPPAPRLSPIEEVVHLIQTSVQHQNVFKQLMIQITQLEQYKDLPHQHQEQLVLQHMAAMFRIQPQSPPQQQQQPSQPPQQQQPPPVQSQQPPQQTHQQSQQEKEAQIQREMEEIRRQEQEKREKEIQDAYREKEIQRQEELKRQEEELQAKQEALLRQEQLIQQQKEQLEREEQKRLEDLRKADEMRRIEEARIKSAQEEAQKQLELAERLKREEQTRLMELDRIRQEEELRIQEEHARVHSAQLLIEKAEQERVRKEKEKETEEKRRKKEEEKRVREKNKAEQERKRKEQEEMQKLQDQLKQERSKKDVEEKERKVKTTQKAVERVRQAAPKWNTIGGQQSPAVLSFKELQMADQEEMKKMEKQNQIEMAQKRADAKAAVDSRNQTGWAGLLRGQGGQQRQGPVVPVSPVVTQKTASAKNNSQSMPKKHSKQKSKDELGFWDSAVDAVLTDKTAVSSRMTQQPAKPNGPESEKAHVRQLFEKLTVSQMEDPLLAWARTELDNIPNAQDVDIPTFVGFLRDLENDYEVEDYARMYFGTGKGVLQFAQKFVEMRKKFRNGAGQGTQSQKKGNKKNRKNKNKANPDLLGFTPAPGDQRNREGQLEGAKS